MRHLKCPADIASAWDAREAGAARQAAWQAGLDAHAAVYPELAGELRRRMSGLLPADWEQRSNETIRRLQAEGGDVATRKSSTDRAQCLWPPAAGVDWRLC